jgi:hypothetical protein
MNTKNSIRSPKEPKPPDLTRKANFLLLNIILSLNLTVKLIKAPLIKKSENLDLPSCLPEITLATKRGTC